MNKTDPESAKVERSGLTRRQALAAGGMASALHLLSPAAFGAEGRANTANELPMVGALNRWLETAPLFNRDNAYAVLDRYGVDALLVSEHTNVYQLTAIKPVTDLMFAGPFECFALLCRDEAQPVRLLMHDFISYYIAADQRPGDWLETRIYTEPMGGDSSQPRDPIMLRVPEMATLSEDERMRRDAIAAMTPGRASGPAAGLVTMLRDAGLQSARIATDSATASGYAAAADLGSQFVGAAPVMGAMRQIKSSIEIDLMRHAAATNARAAMAAARVLRDGGSHSDLRNSYFGNAVEAGGQGVFMAIDRITSPRIDRRFTDGQAFLIDGVAEFFGYHGDFGRTVFLGEPSRQMASIVSEIGEAWQAIRAAMQVGATYDDLIAAGQESIARSGKDIAVAFNVHSVGLWHTDDTAGLGFAEKMATRLKPGMILSVDCPLFDEGIGGSAHYEDLTLITENGPIALNEEFPAALVV